MGFQFRKRGSGGTNFSLSARGPRVSQTMRFGPLTMNVGKTLGQKPNVRTRINFGNGLFWTKQKTLGADQRQVNSNLSEVFDVDDRMEILDRFEISPWISCTVMALAMYFPYIYYTKIIPYMMQLLGLEPSYPIFHSTLFLVAHCTILLLDFILAWVAYKLIDDYDTEWYNLPPYFIANLLVIPLYAVTFLLGLAVFYWTFLGIYSFLSWIFTI